MPRYVDSANVTFFRSVRDRFKVKNSSYVSQHVLGLTVILTSKIMTLSSIELLSIISSDENFVYKLN